MGGGSSAMMAALEKEYEPSRLAVDVALKYLIRSYEIQHSVHGDKHLSVSVASLAVASVLTGTSKFTETREWLGSTIRLMEGLSPFPHRAIASTREQLADALMKQNYLQEAIDVLLLVVRFYRQVVLTRINKVKDNTVYIRPIDSTDRLLWIDLHHYFALTEKIVSMQKKCSQINQSLEQTLSMIDLADIVLGWDSPEFGMTFFIVL